MIRNPIIEREFRTNLRRFRTYFVRSAFVVALVPPLLMVGMGKQSALGTREAFLVLMWVQIGTVVFLSPVFTAGTLSLERRKRTLGTLLLSDLTPWEIVSGTFLPRAAYLVMVILSALPVLFLWIIFGSITGSEILASQVVVLSVAILGASMGIFWSSLTEKAVPALLGSYVSLVMLLGAGPLISRALAAAGLWGVESALPTPLEVMSELFSLEGALSAGGSSAWRWALCAVLFLAPAVPLLAGASWFLHPYRFERLRARTGVLAEGIGKIIDWRRWRIRFLEKQTVGRFANPIAWKELYASRWLGFRGLIFLTVAVSAVSIPVWGFTWSHWEDIRLHQIVVGAEFYLVCIAATIISASSIVQEKETLSLDVLLTTPTRPHTIVNGKAFALTSTFLIPLAYPFFHLVFFTVCGAVNPATPLLFLVVAPMAVTFFVTQSLFISTGVRTVLGAQALALVALHGWLVLGLLGISQLPQIWFFFLPASPVPFVLQGIRPGPAVKMIVPLVPYAKTDTFLLFLLSIPGAVFTMLAAGKILAVLKERFYSFIR